MHSNMSNGIILSVIYAELRNYLYDTTFLENTTTDNEFGNIFILQS